MSVLPAAYRSYGSPLAWEQAWHRYLDILYRETPIAALQLGSELDDAPIHVFPGIQADTCYLQRKLSSLATQKITEDGFADKWRAAGPTAREKHYFEAVKRVLDYPDIEIHRQCVNFHPRPPFLVP
jgi:hypothetical protein